MCFVRLLGLILLWSGTFGTLAVFGLNSSIDPRLSSDAWWAEYWSRLIWDGGFVMVVIGCAVTLLGGWLVVVRADDLATKAYAEPLDPPLPPLKLFDLSKARDEYF